MHSRESGNVVIFILLAVGLFGALAFTFTRGGQQSQGSMNEQQAKVAAQEIMSYMALVEKGTNKLLSRGCSETQLSFENSYDTYHVNAGAPVDKSCHLFDAAGAGISPAKPQDNWFGGTSSEFLYFYTNGDALTDIGTTCTDQSCSELNINIWDISLPLCNALNQLLGITFTTIPTDSFDGCTFHGNFDCDGTGVDIVFAAAQLRGKPAVCYNDSTFGYTFNYTILQR